MATSRVDAIPPRRFGHGTVKMVRQAQSREKLLQKKLEEGLTEKPQRDAEWDFSFPDPGELPTPVLMIQDVSFAYPNSEPLYHNLDLGIDLQSRIALVGPNGAGKTTFVKLMTGELQPTSVTQRGFLRFLNLNFGKMASTRCHTAVTPSTRPHESRRASRAHIDGFRDAVVRRRSTATS